MSMASLGAPVLADLLGIGDAVKDLAGDLAGSAIGELAKAIAEAVTSTLVTLGTLWTKVPNPDLASGVNYETPSAAVGFVQGSLRWYVAAAAILSILVAGARMAWEGRAEPGKQLMKSLATLVIVSSAGVAMIALASDASDEFSSWIITNSTQGTSFGENVGKLLAVGSGGQPTMAVMLVIVLGFLGLITSLIQIMLMIARGGLLVVLAGILPLAASATNTQMGRQWFEKAVAWTVAWILYKPAAAIVYATAFRLLGSGKGAGEGGLLGFCTGLVLMVLAVVALPALLRFTTPLVGSVAGSSSGGGAAAAAIPTGAMMVRGGGGAGGGSRGGGSGAGAAAGGATGAGMAATGVGAAAMAGQAAFKGAQSVGNQAAGDGASSGGGQSSSGGASGGGGGSNGNGSGPTGAPAGGGSGGGSGSGAPSGSQGGNGSTPSAPGGASTGSGGRQAAGGGSGSSRGGSSSPSGAPQRPAGGSGGSTQGSGPAGAPQRPGGGSGGGSQQPPRGPNGSTGRPPTGPSGA